MQIEGAFTKIFVSCFIGLVSCVIVFSILKAKANTINFVLLVIFGFLFYKNKLILSTSAHKGRFTANRTTLAIAFTGLIILPFIYFCCVLFKGGDFYFAAIDNDNVFYSHLSELLSSTGLESRWQNYFGNNQVIYKPGPYHYFDLWFNALVLTIFYGKGLITLYLVTYPLMICISLFGILACVEHYVTIRSLHIVLSVLLLLIGPLYFMRNLNFNFNTNACELPIEHFGEKFAVYYPFIFFTIILLLNHHFKEAIIFLTSLAVVSMSVLPAIFILLFFLLIVYRNKSLINIKKTSFKIFLIFLCIILFYSLNNTIQTITEVQPKQINMAGLNLKGWFVSVANLLVKNSWYFICNYLYCLPLLLFFISRKQLRFNNQRLALLFAPAAGLVASAILFPLTDSYQLFTNILPVFHCLIMLLILKISLETQISKKIRVAIVMLLSLNAVYVIYSSLKEYKTIQTGIGLSDDYMLRVVEIGKSVKSGTKVAHFYTQEDFEKMMTTANSNYLYHLAFTNFDAIPVKLSCASVTDFSKLKHLAALHENLNKQEVFYRYFHEQIANPGLSPESIKNNFMLRENINYAVLSENSPIPDFLRRKVKEIIKDKNTGITFLVLK